MGISALGAVNSVNTKHSMPLSGKGPDWSIIPSSGKSSKSKAEFTDEIKELARKAANTTSKAELEYIHRRRTGGWMILGRNADLPDPDKRGIWSGYLLSGYKGAYISRFGIRVGL